MINVTPIRLFIQTFVIISMAEACRSGRPRSPTLPKAA